MMTRLWLVRHGPTHAKSMIGWTDLPADLSDAAQIARLHAHLPAGAVLQSSDLIRATATADALAQGRHRLQHDPALREIHFGAWEQRSFAEIDAEAPDHIRAFWETPGDVAAPDGESWNDLRARIGAAITALTQTHQGDIIVVAHFGAILAAVQHATGISTAEALSHKIDNLSVTRLDLGPSGWMLHQINHLP
jgi:broad specificity phosphatase PhoE